MWWCSSTTAVTVTAVPGNGWSSGAIAFHAVVDIAGITRVLLAAGRLSPEQASLLSGRHRGVQQELQPSGGVLAGP